MKFVRAWACVFVQTSYRLPCATESVMTTEIPLGGSDEPWGASRYCTAELHLQAAASFQPVSATGTDRLQEAMWALNESRSRLSGMQSRLSGEVVVGEDGSWPDLPLDGTFADEGGGVYGDSPVE
jgi:hypothetical protein